MARPKKNQTAENATTAQQRVIIRAKTPMDWQGLLGKAQQEHWRTLRVEIQVRDKLLAGKPKALDAATAMLKARGLEDFVATAEDIVDPTERAAAAERVKSDEGVCEFVRRPGVPGLWMPSNNIKAGMKENWSVLGLRNTVRGSRGAMAEGLFVRGIEDPDWIKVSDKDEPDGIHTGVAHTTGPSGPIAAIKRNEYIDRPRIRFDIMIANAQAVADKMSDDEIAKTLIHFQEHGLGANRSQGFGCFDVISVEEITAS